MDLQGAVDLIHRAIPAAMPVIINAPATFQPLLSSLFQVTVDQRLRLLVLDRKRFKPIINVLVRQADSYNGLPRFIVRLQDGSEDNARGEIVASAGLNWRSDRFADIYVHTKNAFRRKGLGRSVVAALVDDILKNGRTPIYVVQEDNRPSISLAESVGFINSGADQLLLEGQIWGDS
jgi:ribosomal protein S18 acetylase RimI-like enzyme